MLSNRLAELERLLHDNLTLDEVQLQLADEARMAVAARDSRLAATAATKARQQAEQDRTASKAAVDLARSELRAVREPLITLGAPAVETIDLSAGWAMLSDWAQEAAADRSLRRAEAEMVARDAAERWQQGLTELDALLAGHGLKLPSDLVGVSSSLLLATDRARRDREDIVRRRAEADRLRTTLATDTEQQQVARELQQLMSSRRFPQWLADTALDTLVADASASLLRLSNGQFDLTHERGEFYVIDHADADARRSVRTLSGGETFQASLALALALSEQLSTLAAGGRTTLDSIFLDEGFGTLDPDALEIVAGTLENLAQEDRMVGVITHVAALAERVPVRFEVSRDTRTSTVERVGP